MAMVFREEQALLSPSFNASRKTLWWLVLYATFATTAPVLLPQSAHGVKTASLLTGTAAWFGAGALSQQLERQQQINGAIAKGQKSQIQQSMALQLAQAKREQEMAAAMGTLRWIYFQHPPQMHQALIAKYGLSEFVAAQQQQRANPASAQTVTISAAAPMMSTESLPRPDLDTSWLTSEFAHSSKVIPAGRGSGKSFYLRWELGELTKDENTVLLFIDPHLLANQMDAAEKAGSEQPMAYWFPQMTAEEERQVVIHTPEKAKQELLKVHAETKRRLGGSPSAQRLKVIVEEADSELFTGPGGAGPELVQLLKLVTNEARKVKVDITLIAHTLKKGMTGFDASFLSQMNWLMLGNILGSNDIVWPSDLDTKHWQQERDQLNASLDDSVGRAAVLRVSQHGKNETSVVLIPNFQNAVSEPA